MFRLFSVCLLLSTVVCLGRAEEKADLKKEAPKQATSGMLTDISEKEIVIWVSTGNGEVGIDYGIHIPLTKDTKYFLDEIESTGKKDAKGNEVTKTTRKEITLKDLKTKQAATVIRDEKGNALNVTQTLDKRPAHKDKLDPLPKPGAELILRHGKRLLFVSITEKEITLELISPETDEDNSDLRRYPISKNTKFYLEERKSTGKKDMKGNEIFETNCKEIGPKDLKKGLDTRYTVGGFAIDSVTQYSR